MEVLTLYGMYIFLIIISGVGAYLKIYATDIAVFVLVSVVGHFFGVLTPIPAKVAEVTALKENTLATQASTTALSTTDKSRG